jgi:hypothetical protein
MPGFTMVIPVKVECYAGYRGEQEPRALEMDGNRVAVRSILDRWLSPDHRYFKLSGSDGCEYILRYDESSRTWELVYYRHPDAQGKE